MKETNKKITIFMELSTWQGENIMKNTYYDISKDKFIKYDKVRIEKPIHNNKNESTWEKL